MTTYNNALNTSATDFDMEAFTAIINDFKRAHRAVESIDADQQEVSEKLEAAKANLQKSIDALNYDGMQKYTAECKRLTAKQGEKPEIRFQAFDEAANNLHRFVAELADNQVFSDNDADTEYLRAVGE